MSVVVSGATYHLVSHYTIEDVLRGNLIPPIMAESLRHVRPRSAQPKVGKGARPLVRMDCAQNSTPPLFDSTSIFNCGNSKALTIGAWRTWILLSFPRQVNLLTLPSCMLIENQWIELVIPKKTSLMLAGSTTPPLSIQELVELSEDKKETSRKLSIETLKLSLCPPNGSNSLRVEIAGLYNEVVSADQVLATNGATGANSLAMQSLLRSGDHVIAMFPAYTQLHSVPKAIAGVEISFWELDINDQASANVRELESLIRPSTRLIVLNNPNNPLGTTLSLEVQREIASLAHSHGLILLVDEIFRPLFHDSKFGCPPSFVELVEHYENVVVTGSLSKAWGLAGVRVGWIVTRNASILSQCFDLSLYTLMALSTLDNTIATEALSDRCRPKILEMHLRLARKNYELLSDFVKQNQEVCTWIRPSTGGTAFLRFYSNGLCVDDVDFCVNLLEIHGVLLTPGSLCFAMRGSRDLKGFVHIHLTIQPNIMESALKALGNFVRVYCHRKVSGQDELFQRD